jgi:CheY-like chemotaxis protein
VHPGRLIADLEKMLERTFTKSIRIVIDVAPDLRTVSADRTQLEQVLMNLCVNARDAMPEGGTLTIAARNEINDVVLEVSDTGEGIPPDNLDKIFDPFFTTKAVGTGTGLGLSTVNAIIKSHGGFVTVASTVKRGTTFKVHLPALPDGAQKEEDTVREAFPIGKGEVILVVDDEAAVRDLTRTILENYGYRVLVASDGVEGVATYSRHQGDIDLVLTDLDMPRMAGPQFIRILERINPEIRIITASGLMQDDLLDEVSDRVRAVLQKPFSPGQLLQTLRKVLR